MLAAWLLVFAGVPFIAIGFIAGVITTLLKGSYTAGRESQWFDDAMRKADRSTW